MSKPMMYDIKLLIVEDDKIISSIYKRVLEKTIANIILANNGKEGLELYKQHKPDLILTDIKMPIMNGLDMIKEIREINKEVRIIIMSAYGESRYFLNAIESGVKGFLIKPIKNDDLKRVITGQVKDILLEYSLIEEEKKRISAEKKLIELNKNLENRVKERTRELEIEIAERTNAQQLLRESEEKYRLIYETASDGILLIQNGIIILLNPTMVEFFEKIPREIIGRPLEEFVKSDNADLIKEFFTESIKENTQNSFEILIHGKTDKYKWLELNVNSIMWDEEPAYLVFATNITLRKLAEIKLQDLNKELEKRIKEEVEKAASQQQLLIQKSKLESLGELSAGLAHEINQPLGGILMGLENISYKAQTSEVNNDYLLSKIKVLFMDIERIKQIINHVRTFSRDQQSGKTDKISVKKVISDSISLINRQYTNHEIKLEVDTGGDELFIEGNQFKLEQVILNLLSNSKSAVENRAKIGKDKTYKKVIRVFSETDDKYVYIYVSDNGTGIPANIFDKIFDPFFTTKDEKSGTGLGLSISYGIVKEMNGTIRVESSQNKCTKMTIELPKYKAK